MDGRGATGGRGVGTAEDAEPQEGSWPESSRPGWCEVRNRPMFVFRRLCALCELNEYYFTYIRLMVSPTSILSTTSIPDVTCPKIAYLPSGILPACRVM